MSGVNDTVFWIAIPLLAVGTFFLRYVMIGVLADRPLPPPLGRALHYVPAAVLPAIAAPLIAYDKTGALQSDPAKLIAIFAAVAIGGATRNLLWTIIGGMGALWAAQAMLG